MIIGELCIGTSFEKRYYLQENLYNFLGKKYKKFYFINCHNIFNKEKLKINYSFFKKKNIIFFNPKSITELNNFLNKNKIFLINNLSFKFCHMFFHFLVSKNNIFQISFLNTPILSNYKLENWIYVNFLTKMSFLFRKKFSVLCYRILIILRIINQIDALYIARKDIFKRYLSSQGKRVFLIKKYKNIESTSIRLPLFKKKNEISNKYITFIDSNVLHNDYLRRGHQISDVMVKSYFFFLKTYLMNIKKKFHKDVIVCLHPSSDYQLYKKELSGLKVYKYKTERYIVKSFLVLFHESTPIFSAILLKKKIICLKSDIMGAYSNARRNFYLNKIDLVEHNIQKKIQIKKKLLIRKLDKNIDSYEKFITKSFYTDKNSLPIQNIIDNNIQQLRRSNKFL